MKPSERIKQLATDIRNTDMMGVRLPTSHTPKIQDYLEAIVQFLDEQGSRGNDWICDQCAYANDAERIRCGGCGKDRQPQEFPGFAVHGAKWSWDKDLADLEPLASNLRSEGKESRAEIVEYLIARCRRAEARK